MELQNAIVLSVIMITAIVVPIVLVLRTVFSSHDPKRAARHVEVATDGSFRLELPGPHAGEVFLRFEAEGHEDAQDLVVRGTVRSREGERAFGVRTKNVTAIDGARDETTPAISRVAVSGARASILLVEVLDVPAVVEGRVETAREGELVRGWVYLPG